MPRAPKRCPAPDCDTLITGRAYCDQHQRDQWRRNQSPSSRAAHNPRERARRKAAITAWVNINGWVCPGYRRDPHPSRDLTAAHAHAVARGGADSLLTVLCRTCNARQGTTPS